MYEIIREYGFQHYLQKKYNTYYILSDISCYLISTNLIPLTVEVRLFICCESPSDMATECADDIWCDEADIL